MKAVGGIEVKLRVSGASLEEYEVPAEEDAAEDGKALTKYVEAVSGSTFAVRIVLPACATLRPDDGVACNVYLDGEFVTGRSCYSSQYRSAPFILLIEGIDSMTPRGRELQRFTFAQLKTIDGPLTANTKPEHFKDIGTIMIECTWCRQVPTRYADFKEVPKTAIGKSIPEKCLKGRAISNQAGVAKPEPLEGIIKTAHLSYPHGNFPFATFQYKYRSRKDLQIEGIVEKDPEPVALEDRDPASLTAEEVGQLQRQLHAKQGDLIKIKKEKRAWVHADDSEHEEDVEVVFGGAPQKKRKAAASKLELIDLTDA